MKFVFAFLLSLFLVSCSLLQPRTARTTSQLSEKEITTITQLIGKEKIAKEVYENFYEQYQNNSLRIDSKSIEQYSRKSLTGELAKVLNNLIDN